MDREEIKIEIERGVLKNDLGTISKAMEKPVKLASVCGPPEESPFKEGRS